ncbi:hypothetical protein L1887_36429 [Cichorium endivia]|nr:hypothetical protein L1887_36429 [Cichorium endivia]
MLTIVNDDSFSRSRFLLQFDWSFLLQFDWTVTEITVLLYPIGATTIPAAHCRHHRRSSTSPAPPPSQQHFTVTAATGDSSSIATEIDGASFLLQISIRTCDFDLRFQILD